MRVSVVGTVFLVNADDDGSNVGVIEGEVRMREGALETTLHPGEQASTRSTLAALPLTQAVAWSPGRTRIARFCPPSPGGWRIRQVRSGG
jgi:ferric-dicitrate binding protein FerR (iron transport regulator)